MGAICIPIFAKRRIDLLIFAVAGRIALGLSETARLARSRETKLDQGFRVCDSFLNQDLIVRTDSLSMHGPSLPKNIFRNDDLSTVEKKRANRTISGQLKRVRPPGIRKDTGDSHHRTEGDRQELFDPYLCNSGRRGEAHIKSCSTSSGENSRAYEGK